MGVEMSTREAGTRDSWQMTFYPFIPSVQIFCDRLTKIYQKKKKTFKCGGLVLSLTTLNPC